MDTQLDCGLVVRFVEGSRLTGDFIKRNHNFDFEY